MTPTTTTLSREGAPCSHEWNHGPDFSKCAKCGEEDWTHVPTLASQQAARAGGEVAVRALVETWRDAAARPAESWAAVTRSNVLHECADALAKALEGGA